MKLVLTYSLFLFLAALACEGEKKLAQPEPMPAFTYRDLAMWVKVTDSGIIRVHRDSAEYMMEYDYQPCGGVDTLLTNAIERATRWHNPDSCEHTKNI